MRYQKQIVEKTKTVLRVHRDNSLSFSLLNHKKIIPGNQTPTVGFGKFFWLIFIFWKNSVLRKLLYKVFWKREKNSKKLPKTFQISSPTYLAHPAWIFPTRKIQKWKILVDDGVWSHEPWYPSRRFDFNSVISNSLFYAPIVFLIIWEIRCTN